MSSAKPFSFLFAGTSDFALSCLKLLKASPILNLKGVISRPDSQRGRGMKNQSSSVKAFAEQNNLPVWTPEKPNDPQFLEEIKKQKCDFSFVCSYGRILPPEFLKLFPKGGLNLHLSLLPQLRGAAPAQRALMAGYKKTGISLQIMTEELDAGDIISQKEFPITEDDNSKDIFCKALKEAGRLIQEDLPAYLQGSLKARPQNHEQAGYAPKIKKEEARIVWTEPARAVHNKIRALFLGPQAFALLKGKRVKFYRAAASAERFPKFYPGEVCRASKKELLIACGTGALRALELQKEGRKPQKIEDFLRGEPLRLKDQFE